MERPSEHRGGGGGDVGGNHSTEGILHVFALHVAEDAAVESVRGGEGGRGHGGERDHPGRRARV
eukprot:31056-Pelagococcus_subviridis.AAC.1